MGCKALDVSLTIAPNSGLIQDPFYIHSKVFFPLIFIVFHKKSVFDTKRGVKSNQSNNFPKLL